MINTELLQQLRPETREQLLRSKIAEALLTEERLKREARQFASGFVQRSNIESVIERQRRSINRALRYLKKGALKEAQTVLEGI